MELSMYERIRDYMSECVHDNAHDREHINRVLAVALDIAQYEPEGTVDGDVLVAACLLHDIGRPEQMSDPSLCHAEVGSKKAYDFLKAQGWSEDKACHVRDCILTHRFRVNNQPATIEAKILFDADKVDATGALGLARTIYYKATLADVLYTRTAAGEVLDGTAKDEPDSLFREYRFKLRNLYGQFWTARATELAEKRRAAAESFYEDMLGEVRSSYSGMSLLGKYVKG